MISYRMTACSFAASAPVCWNLGGESGTDRHPTVYPGTYVEYVQKLGHEAPGTYSRTFAPRGTSRLSPNYPVFSAQVPNNGRRQITRKKRTARIGRCSLGNSIKIADERYAPWVKSKQLILDGAVMKTWS